MTTTNDIAKDMDDADHPLRLAVGSHEAGSGKGCAMNVISWESGDSTITDLPACADEMLARIVQRVNDSICTHRDGDLLCPPCSVEVLALGHRIVGTGTHPLSELEQHRIWVRVAADQARQVADLNPDPRVMAAIMAAEAWADDPSEANAAAAAAAALRAADAASTAAADAASTAAAAYADAAAAAAYADAAAAAALRAAYAAHAASTAAAYADAAAAAASTAHAAYAFGYAADAADDASPSQRLALAHRAVDLWSELAGFTPTATDPAVTAAAVAQMEVVR